MKYFKFFKTIALALILTACLAVNAAVLPALAETSFYSADDQFSNRDLKQTADLSSAEYITVTDGADVTISAEGVYVLSGAASDVTILVDADDAKVQLVLDGLTITNADAPCVQVEEADKVFVTLSGENALSVTGKFAGDADAVIYSRDDLVFNGEGALTISSTANGVVGKDDVKFTGGTYYITAASKAVGANDSIRVSGGVFTLDAGTDGLHAENNDDDTLGYLYISGGSFTINVGDDALHANSVAQIDGGEFTITGAEGIEATYVLINGGTINISASDDGINGAQKSSAYTATVEFNGGETTIVMGAGDTDGVDCNGNIIINGGTVSVTGNSTFDYDGAAQYNGGTIIVNGQQVDSLPNQMMGGGMMGGMNGGMAGGMNGGMAGGMMGGMAGGMNGSMNGGMAGGMMGGMMGGRMR